MQNSHHTSHSAQEVNNFMGQSEKRCKQLEEQLRKTKENHESQISELKLLCDHRIAVLDKRFAEKEQVPSIT